MVSHTTTGGAGVVKSLTSVAFTIQTPTEAGAQQDKMKGSPTHCWGYFMSTVEGTFVKHAWTEFSLSCGRKK